MNKLKPLLLSAFIALLVLTIGGCNSSLFDQRISEGIIEYSVSYPYLEDNSLEEFMPDKMTLKFKDDQYITELSAGMGLFKMNFISDTKNKQLKQLIKLANSKYATTMEPEDIDQYIHAYENLTLIHTSDEKVIGGYRCKKSLVIFDDIRYNNFYVYHTDQIALEQPNWSSPLHQIDGVLMEYELLENGIVMRLTATEVRKEDIPSSSFMIPETYLPITPKKMRLEIDEIFRSFKF